MNAKYDGGINDGAKRGDIEKVRKALRNGVHADCLTSKWSGENEMRAVHLAAYHNHKDILLLLIDAGADIHRRHQGSYTPLHYAAFFKHHDIARILIDAGADPNVPDDEGRTAVTHARDKKDERMLQILLGEEAQQ